MNVVRHHHEHMREPDELFIPKAHGIEQWSGHIRPGELIWTALLAVNSDEVRGLLRINPHRHIVRQPFARRNFHEARVNTLIEADKLEMDRPKYEYPIALLHAARGISARCPYHRCAKALAVGTPRRGVPAPFQGRNSPFYKRTRRRFS